MNPFLLASIETSADLVDFRTALLLILTGGLLFLAKATADLYRRIQTIESGNSPEAIVPNQPSVAPVSPAGERIAPEILAVISAAVAVSMKGTPHRIVAISPAPQAWSLEGRRQIFQSHTVRPAL